MGNVAMAPASVEQLKGQTATFAKTKPSELAIVTQGKAAIPLGLGIPAMYSEGKEIVDENGVADPAARIRSKLEELLRQQHKMNFVNVDVGIVGDDVGAIAASYGPKARYVIEVQTTDWAFASMLYDASTFRLNYVAKARLIDTQSKTVLMQSRCHLRKFNDRNQAGFPYEEMRAQRAERVKTETNAAADDCSKQFMRELQPN
ncbi:hypothetical protein [Sphaerotilus microaerophilus]|uniref:Uncharacterized protein n=1 Tax=Sphaerotilus microaerophilus TaxID=2914710 RepID=A0ABN6PSP5_9BURK|nr:hypothetical protein [Sphaerotilus sp. FB-5]BDI07427.1 hypothetical protein CATMQ487_43970 [Sphaerotilus sp. FB-5]